MTLQDEKQIATGFYHGLQLVAGYMKDRVHPKQEELINAGDRENCLRGLFLRALGMTNTLARLNDPLDFQSIMAITRGLLELTVDMVLIHHDKSPNSAAKMHWWGESAKLKQAEATVNYYARCGRPVPDHHQFMVTFVQNSKGLIEKLRSGLWPNKKGTGNSIPKHPNRWTGRDLLSDAREADRLEGPAIKKDLFMGLEEFYETEFRKMCWNVHGSGVVTVAGVPEQAFYITAGLGYKWCADLAMFCSQLILIDFGFTQHLVQLTSEWDEIKHNRATAFVKQASPIA